MRAVQTARPLAEPRGLAIESIEDLEEVRLDDGQAGEFRHRAMWTTRSGWRGAAPIGGTASRAARAIPRRRVTNVIEAVALRHRGQTTAVVVVVHGGAVNAYLAALLEIPDTLWLEVPNTSITVVVVHGDGHHVIVAGDCHQLYDPVLAG